MHGKADLLRQQVAYSCLSSVAGNTQFRKRQREQLTLRLMSRLLPPSVRRELPWQQAQLWCHHHNRKWHHYNRKWHHHYNRKWCHRLACPGSDRAVCVIRLSVRLWLLSTCDLLVLASLMKLKPHSFDSLAAAHRNRRFPLALLLIPNLVLKVS